MPLHSVRCGKCQKQVRDSHRFKLVDQGVEHINCDNPKTGAKQVTASMTVTPGGEQIKSVARKY